jgi:DNA-directed RNA polymerase specialized sigma24 family protein
MRRGHDVDRKARPIVTRDAYGRVYQSNFEGTVRFLRLSGAAKDHAEDIAQAAWVSGLERLQGLDDEEIIVSWVNGTAAELHRDTIRHEARYQALSDLYGQIGVDLARIDAARTLAMCRPHHRVLFEQQLAGLTIREIAIQQGVSPTAIRTRFLRAHRTTRATLEGRAVKLSRSARIREHGFSQAGYEVPQS